MKKIVLLLLISLFPMILLFSQSIYPKIESDSTILITTTQLKETNLIFLEHSKFVQENKVLQSEIINLNDKIVNLNKIDSLKSEQITRYQLQVDLSNKVISNLNNTIAKEKKKTTLVSIGGIGLALLILILK